MRVRRIVLQALLALGCALPVAAQEAVVGQKECGAVWDGAFLQTLNAWIGDGSASDRSKHLVDSIHLGDDLVASEYGQAGPGLCTTEQVNWLRDLQVRLATAQEAERRAGVQKSIGEVAAALAAARASGAFDRTVGPIK